MSVDRLDTLDTLNNLRVSLEREFSRYQPETGGYGPAGRKLLAQDTLKLLRVSNVSKLYYLSNVSTLSTVKQSFSHAAKLYR